MHEAGGKVYHDVTEKKWAIKSLHAGVDGLIAVNNRAGGHAGNKTDLELFSELKAMDLPIICAGGVGTKNDFVKVLKQGYCGVQMGTRFIATTECGASDAYKQAIVNAKPQDIVLTERITGVPVSVIRSEFVDKKGLKPGPIAQRLLRHHKGKYLMRLLYGIKSLYQLKRASRALNNSHGYWQAGKSVAGVSEIKSAQSIVRQLAETLEHRSVQK